MSRDRTKPRYAPPTLHSFDREAVRDMLGPVSLQYAALTVDLPPVDSGTVTSSPFLPPVNGAATCGDGIFDVLSQGYVGFDLSGIPATSIVDAATISFTPNLTVGTPFSDLGPLVVAIYDWGTAIDAPDFSAVGFPIGSMTFLPSSIDVRATVQGAVSSGSVAYRLTLYFNTPTTTDGASDPDLATFLPSGMTLRVSYH